MDIRKTLGQAGVALLAVVFCTSAIGAVVVFEGAAQYGRIAGYIPYIEGIDAPTDLAYDPNNGDLYASQAISNNISVTSPGSPESVGAIQVEPPTPSGSLPGQGFSSSVVVDSVDHKVFVSTLENLTVIDDRTNSVVATLVGLGGMALAYDPIDDEVFVDQGSNVTVVNASSDRVVDSIWYGGAGGNWGPMVFNPLEDQVLVGKWGPEGCQLNCSPNPIVIIDARTNSVVGSLVAPSFPDGLAVDTKNGDLYVASGYYLDPNDTGEVSVYSLVNDRLLTNIPIQPAALGDRPIAFDPANGYLYVASWTGQFGNNLTVVDGSSNSVLGTIALPAEDRALVVDPSNGQIYVGTLGPPGLTIVSPQPVFAGLPEWEAYLALGVALPAAVAILGVVIIRRERRRAAKRSPGIGDGSGNPR